MYRIRILDAAAKELEGLDPPTRDRIVQRLRWLATHIEETDPDPFKGPLRGMNKLRIGDYRVVYELLREKPTIVVHLIGHRSKIYRRR
jgi:mRNA interferase RelE/StbE